MKIRKILLASWKQRNEKEIEKRRRDMDRILWISLPQAEAMGAEKIRALLSVFLNKSIIIINPCRSEPLDLGCFSSLTICQQSKLVCTKPTCYASWVDSQPGWLRQVCWVSKYWCRENMNRFCKFWIMLAVLSCYDLSSHSIMCKIVHEYAQGIQKCFITHMTIIDNKLLVHIIHYI